MLCSKIEHLKTERWPGHISGHKERLQQHIDRVQADLDKANDMWEANDREKKEIEAKSWALTDMRWDRLPQWCRSER